jgi:hypothetical protein
LESSSVGYESEPDTRLDDSFSHQGTPEKYAVATGTEGAVSFSEGRQEFKYKNPREVG